MRLFLSLLLLSATCCSESNRTPVESEQSDSEVWFEDVATDWGVDFVYNNEATGEFHIKEVTGGAPALFDMDNDGDLDLYVVQGSSQSGNVLYENVEGLFVNRSVSSGADDAGYGIGVSTGDYNQDGFTDLYVTNLGTNCLLHNNGDGTFRDVTAFAGVEEEGFSACSSFGDVDGDGDLDLIVTTYLDAELITDRVCLDSMSRRTYCNPVVYNAEHHDSLFINNGDGTFTDVTQNSGFASLAGTGLGVFIADLTGDKKNDIFVANDAMPDRLWVNNGNGTFSEEASLRSIAVDDSGRPKAGMGATPVDIDQDGDLDVYVTNIYGESDSFFYNSGDYFQDMTRRSGLSAETRAFTRWGIVFEDFDNDSMLDLYETTGGVATGATQHSELDPLAEPNLLFKQSAKGRFVLVEPRGGTAKQIVASSHGVASGDIDGDGGVDLVVVNSNAPLNILKNVVANRGNWISVRVVNQFGSDDIGSVVELELSNGTKQFSEIMTAHGYASAHDPRAHFGLGEERVKLMKIHRSDGTSQLIENPMINRIHTVQYAE